MGSWLRGASKKVDPETSAGEIAAFQMLAQKIQVKWPTEMGSRWGEAHTVDTLVSSFNS